MKIFVDPRMHRPALHISVEFAIDMKYGNSIWVIASSEHYFPLPLAFI